MSRGADFKQTLCADIDGFSLDAARRCGADDCQAVAQLCRYNARPARPAQDRRPVQTNAASQVVPKLKTSWRDGTTQLVICPLEFMREPQCVGAEREAEGTCGAPGARGGHRRAEPIAIESGCAHSWPCWAPLAPGWPRP